jgi:hypothetical protein
MYENGKMRPVETILRMRGWRESRMMEKGEFNYDIL